MNASLSQLSLSLLYSFLYFSNSGKIFLALKANSLFFFFEKLQLQFQKDFIMNANGLDLIVIVEGGGRE